MTIDIGEKLKHLRQQRNLTQEELADRCELTKGFISQVERNLASPSIATLNDILEALGTDLRDFFSDAQTEKIIFSQDDMFEKLDAESGCDILWLVPVAQKNRMEPILVTLRAGGQSLEVPPHEGEEFGYVLSGAVQLNIGAKRYRLKAGESFSIHPAETHSIVNKGKREAKLIWISSPPNF